MKLAQLSALVDSQLLHVSLLSLASSLRVNIATDGISSEGSTEKEDVGLRSVKISYYRACEVCKKSDHVAMHSE
jgi:hypothetical protein